MLLRMLMLLCLAWPLTATAADDGPYRVRVFKVFDGDRLLVRTRYHSQRVQLAGIDAPELDQPGGEGSRALLEKMVARKRVLIRVVGQNTVGESLVHMQWRDHDIAMEMVRSGAAWADPVGGAALRDAESEARERKLGIWADDLPPAVRPSQWRAEHRQD